MDRGPDAGITRQAGGSVKAAAAAVGREHTCSGGRSGRLGVPGAARLRWQSGDGTPFEVTKPQGALHVKSLFVGVFALYLLLVLVMVMVGPLLMLRERRKRRAAESGRGRAA